jgi:hypothetical protein
MEGKKEEQTMRKYIEIISLVIGLMASAATLIENFEVPGFGKEKKAAVLAILGQGFNFAKMKIPGLDLEWSDVTGLMSTAIDTIVAFFTAIGKFKTSEPSS